MNTKYTQSQQKSSNSKYQIPIQTTNNNNGLSSIVTASSSSSLAQYQSSSFQSSNTSNQNVKNVNDSNYITIPITTSTKMASQQQQKQHREVSNLEQSTLVDNNSVNSVKFIDQTSNGNDDREKYLTAKYPNHQMKLIKKRLKVEFWIDDRLKYLFNINDNDTKDDYNICPDDLVDSLLDIETDQERRIYIINQLTDAKKPIDQIMQFADELLVKLRIL